MPLPCKIITSGQEQSEVLLTLLSSFFSLTSSSLLLSLRRRPTCAISEKFILPAKTAHRPDSLLRIIFVKIGYHFIALLSRKIFIFFITTPVGGLKKQLAVLLFGVFIGSSHKKIKFFVVFCRKG